MVFRSRVWGFRVWELGLWLFRVFWCRGVKIWGLWGLGRFLQGKTAINRFELPMDVGFRRSWTIRNSEGLGSRVDALTRNCNIRPAPSKQPKITVHMIFHFRNLNFRRKQKYARTLNASMHVQNLTDNFHTV